MTQRVHRPSRRALLHIGALGLGAASGFARLARADVPLPAGRAFLLCYFPGGWDQLLLLDPRDPTAFPESARSRTLIDPRYEELAGAGFRPTLVRPASGPLVFGPLGYRPGARVQLTDFADRMAVVRGIDMASLGHEIAYRYFLTTVFPSGTSARGTNIATELSAQLRPRRPIPNLSVRVESYNDRHPGRWSALQVHTVDDMLTVLAPSMPVGDTEGAALAAFGAQRRAEVYNQRGRVDRFGEAQTGALELVRADVGRSFRFLNEDTEEAVSIRTRYAIPRGLNDGPNVRAALASLALKRGLSQVVTVDVGEVTDTHFVGNLPHARLLEHGLSSFLALMDDLRTSPHPEGGSMLDHTTVLGFSEFARAPMYNQYGGRDHHIAGSCMLLGAGVRPGAVVGATSDLGMAPMLWDLAANRASPDGERLTPAHLGATLCAAAGVDPSPFRAPPLTALLR